MNGAVVSGTPLTTAIENYLRNVKKLKAHKTWCAYRRADELFGQQCQAKKIEAITRQDVLDHIDYLSNDLRKDSRTVFNHCELIGIMLRSYGVNISAMLKRNEKPTYNLRMTNIAW